MHEWGGAEYLDLWALSNEGVEVHPDRGGARGEQVLEDAFSSPQHLRCGAVVVPQLQCLSPCHTTRKVIELADHASS